jgi:hypothetical protein
MAAEARSDHGYVNVARGAKLRRVVGRTGFVRLQTSVRLAARVHTARQDQALDELGNRLGEQSLLVAHGL